MARQGHPACVEHLARVEHLTVARLASPGTHALERYDTAFYQPIVSDWRNFETWQADVAQTPTQRATRWRRPPVRRRTATFPRVDDAETIGDREKTSESTNTSESLDMGDTATRSRHGS